MSASIVLVAWLTGLTEDSLFIASKGIDLVSGTRKQTNGNEKSIRDANTHTS